MAMVESWLSDRVTKSNKLQQEFPMAFPQFLTGCQEYEPSWANMVQ